MELLLAFAIGLIIISSSAGALFGVSSSNLRSYQNQQAAFLLQEGVETVRFLAADNWENVNVNGFFHPEIIDNNWHLEEDEEIIGDYKRRVEIADLYRDENGQVATEAGILDPSAKKITVQVNWQDPKPDLVFQTFIQTRWQNNISWIEDTLEDFQDGEEDAADAVINPGYIQLAQTGGGGWSEPASLGTVDGQAKASGICANSTHLYLTQDKILGGAEVFNLADPENPVSRGVIAWTYRPNDCTLKSGYLYVANSLPIGSIFIYNIGQNPESPPFVDSLGLFYQAGGIWATDDYLFVSSTSWPYNFIVVYRLDGAYDTNPQYIGSFLTTGETVDVAVSGNYLYVAQKSTSRAVEIYNIAVNPAAPTHVGTVSTLYNPTGIWSESNILYLSMSAKRGAMYSLAQNPVNPQLYGYFPTVRNSADVAAFGDYGYVAGVDSQLKVIEIFDLSDSKGISGIYFVYGEYISSVLDTGVISAFNRIYWEANEPANTDVLFQTAVNNDNLTWNFVGPDGTGGTYFEANAGFPLDNCLGRYLKYKAILTGDGDTTPLVDKVIINYSQ